MSENLEPVKEIGRILIYGDIHLNSKNYGGHRDYPNETLDVLRSITNKAREINATHIIGLGDFAFGRFHTLEYRQAVENELTEQYNICNGNRYEIKGNHDSASYGMTEYEYYVDKGLLKEATNLDIGNLCISMIPYGGIGKVKPNIKENYTNIILAHDYLKFEDTQMPNFGKPTMLDRLYEWYGVDNIVCGHIHSSGIYSGVMLNKENEQIGKRVTLDYLGSMSRPAYLGDRTDTVGHMLFLTVYSNCDVKYDRLDIALKPIEEIFNLEEKEKEHEKKQEKQEREKVDLSDIVHALDSHNRVFGNPEEIIMSLENVSDKVKQKAVYLLRLSQA